MASVTFLLRNKVALVSPGRFYTIVAGRTGPEYLIVIDLEYRHPGCRCMAVFTDTCREHVLWMLSGCGRAVVTADAIIRGVGMIIVRWCPGDGCMAIVTIVATDYVGRVFTGRGIAVMAGTTTAEDLYVIHGYGRHPDSSVVAVFADVRGLNMRHVLAGRRCAIVAIAATVRDVVVIEICRQPRDGRMTILANIVAIDMCRVFTCRIGSVVAVGAVANNSDVIKSSRQPPNGRMAVVTVVATVDVIEVLTARNDAIMTRATCADYLSMIDYRCRRPDINAVAIFTDSR